MPGGFPVAPEATNALRSVRLRLCALQFYIPVEPKDEKHRSKAHVNAIFDALAVEVLKDAFVILIPDSSSQDSAAKPILARTTATGQLVWIAEKDLGGTTPASPANDMFLDPRKTYRYFWTRRSSLCRKIWKFVKDDATSAIANHPFSVLRTEEAGSSPDLQHLGIEERNRNKMALLLSVCMPPSRGSSPVPSSLVPGGSLSKLVPQGTTIDLQATYAIAHSASVTASFVSELIMALANDVMDKTAEDRAVFETIRDMALKATKGDEVELLQEELMRGELFGQYFCRGDWHKAYYPYAHKCAMKKVPRKLFADAVDASNDSKAWQDAAAQIMVEYSIKHPDYPTAQDTQDKKHSNTVDWKVQVEPVLKIFDFYTFGFECVASNPNARWNGTSEAAKRAIERKLAGFARLCGNLLQKQANYKRLLQELDAQYPDDFELRKQLHSRYLQLSIVAKYPWWKEIDESFIASIKPYSDWFSADSAKLPDLMNHFFGEPKSIVELNHLLEESVDEFEHMFEKMIDFNNGFHGKTIKRKIIDGTELTADFKNNRLTVKIPEGEVKELDPLYFVVRTNEETVVRQERQLRPKDANLRRNRVRLKRVETKASRVVVKDIPLKKLHTVPLWLGAFGDTLALAMAISQLGKQLEKAEDTKEKVYVLGKTAGGALSAVGSVTDAINYTFFCKTKIPWVLEHASPASKLIEAYFNAKEGWDLVTFGEDSEVIASLEKGDSFDAVLLTTKGLVLYCSVIPGAAAFGGALFAAITAGTLSSLGVVATVGGALATALPPLGFALAIAAVVVSGIDLVRYLRNGPENAMASVADRLKRAIKEELGNFEKGYAYSRTATLLDSLSNHSQCLLAAVGA